MPLITLLDYFSAKIYAIGEKKLFRIKVTVVFQIKTAVLYCVKKKGSILNNFLKGSPGGLHIHGEIFGNL